jgi:lipase
LLQEAGDDAVYDDYCRFAEGFMADADAGREDAAWEAFVDLRNGAGTWQAMPEKARTRLRGLTRQTVDGFKSNLSNPTSLADIRQLDIPTLVVCGGNTTLAERRITEILARTLPDCRYVTIPDAEHMSPVTHPAAVAAVIAEHLAMSDELRRRRAG